MKKIFKSLSLIVLILPVLLLSGCNDSTYINYNDAINILETASYTVEATTNEQIIYDEVGAIATAYNSYVYQQNISEAENGSEYRLTSIYSNDISVNSMISANKDNLYCYIFYCEDEASAILLSNCFTATSSSYFSIEGASYAVQDGNFAFIYSEAVNEVLNLAS